MSAVSDLFDHPSEWCGSARGIATHAAKGEHLCPDCLEAYNDDPPGGRRVKRIDRQQVVERMKALDAHRAARATLREQTRVDL